MGAQELAQVRAVDVLHGEEGRLAVGADVVDLGDVRVGERRRQPRLVEEHAQQLGVERVLRQDALEHDQLLEPLDADAGQPREVDLGHPTDGQAADRLVAADPSGRCRGASRQQSSAAIVHRRLAADARDRRDRPLALRADRCCATAILATFSSDFMRMTVTDAGEPRGFRGVSRLRNKPDGIDAEL